MKNWIKNLKDYKQLVSLVILGAPDDFPIEDYLPKNEQLNLDSCFEYLREALYIVREISGTEEVRTRFLKTLNYAYDKYRIRDVAHATESLLEIRADLEEMLSSSNTNGD